MNSGCDPISSNCIIWQGPDITCINLCRGDSISDVVYKLATELCNLMLTFNISNYDLECFNLQECAPKDFQALINFLIGKICELEGVEQVTPRNTNGCPDCLINVCPQFYYQNPQGDTVTSMQLSDYVIAIGNKICILIGQITTINAILENHENRITILEDTPIPQYQLPELIPFCLNNNQPLRLDLLTAALEQAFCTLQNHTGNPQMILAAIQKACANLAGSDRLNGFGPMSSIPGWVLTPANLAESFGNLWLTVCDLRNSVQSIKLNCCQTDCDDINIIILASLTNPTTLVLHFLGTVPTNYIDLGMGSTIELTDAGGGGPQILNGIQLLTQYIATGLPLTITLNTVNGANNVFVKLIHRFIDPISQSSCENITEVTVLGTDSCPDLVLAADYTAIDYAFTWNGTTPKIIGVELWNATGTVMLQSVNLNVTSTTPSGDFINLTENTNYKIRLVIDGLPCDFYDFSTLAHPCVAPILAAPTIDYSDPEGDTNGNTIAGWIVAYQNAH